MVEGVSGDFFMDLEAAMVERMCDVDDSDIERASSGFFQETIDWLNQM